MWYIDCYKELMVEDVLKMHTKTSAKQQFALGDAGVYFIAVYYIAVCPDAGV
jgi:hypothetical protein